MTDPTHQRWYDQYNHISSLIKMTEQMPTGVQYSIGDNLLSTIERYKEIADKNDALKSLGADVVLGLYKSRRKLRWYDQIPELHKAFTMMATLPPHFLGHLNGKCSDLVQYMAAQRSGRAAPTNAIAHMINTYLAITEHDNDMSIKEPTPQSDDSTA